MKKSYKQGQIVRALQAQKYMNFYKGSDLPTYEELENLLCEDVNNKHLYKQETKEYRENNYRKFTRERMR